MLVVPQAQIKREVKIKTISVKNKNYSKHFNGFHL